MTDLVTNARVPVLKCRSLELIDIDVTLNNLLPMRHGDDFKLT